VAGRTAFLAVILLALPLLPSCSRPARRQLPAAARHGAPPVVGTWAYQLQGTDGAPIDLAALAGSSADLLVVDYAADGTPLTSAQVRRLKRRPGAQPRLVLAYLSIGEAEDYRFYWRTSWSQRPPGFVYAANPDWPGNFKVRYWDPRWRTILWGSGRGYLDRIIDAGFDGVYLDVIDAFEFFGPDGPAPIRPSAAADMAALVIDLAGYARRTRRRREFLVVPQNGANLPGLLPPALARSYLATIDGIGAEDTFFYGDRPEDNPLAIQRETLAALVRLRKAGKFVLAVDYLADPKMAREFVRLARDHGFVPYVGVRALDRLVPQP
jgi:cysteinyl-tRNA synthetase, unknown class